MSVSEHDLNCFCGQPVDVTATSAAVHCPRCGRTLDRGHLTPARPTYAALLLRRAA
jgi:predicted RNA-binding Zn-ribbon protein involved in translation (DUF1610 family)